MTQNVVDFSDNPTGAGLMDDYLDKEQQNVLTSNSGIQRPSYAVAGTKWLNTSATPWVLNFYDGTSDVALGTVNPTTHLFTSAGVYSKQDISNLSQTLDDSTTKYPSNAAVKAVTDTKANDIDVLHKTGDEKIAGIKDFEDDITAPNQIDYTNITNCITEIPQDIKLELNNGTLTLKAGSKVYVPNGAGVFEVKTAQQDFTMRRISNAKELVFVRWSGDNITVLDAWTNCYSGTSAPSGQTFMAWYDTLNNIVKGTVNGGSTWTETLSFSIAIINEDSNQITSIDQVFNGFGYIGSTVFALPGVKGLIPNGRKTDGSLKNEEFEITSVNTYTSPTNYTFSNYGWVLQEGKVHPYDLAKYEYREDENYNYQLYSNEVTRSVILAYGSVNAGVTTSFTPKTAFHAVDRNDSSWLSGLGMPSSKYIDLTLGASGSTYTAPANGWIEFVKQSTGAQYFQFANNTSGWFNNISTPDSGQYLSIFAPVYRGDSFKLEYNLGGVTARFRFYYAEGETN